MSIITSLRIHYCSFPFFYLIGNLGNLNIQIASSLEIYEFITSICYEEPMRQRVYADTSVFGGYFDENFQDGSIQLFEHFKRGNKILVLSDLILRELELAPSVVRNLINDLPKDKIEFVTFNEESHMLAKRYIEEEVVTKKYILDAQHIAIATVYHVDVLVSWNFKHIVNLRRIQLYNSTNLKYGYPFIEIRSPKEILDE